MAHAFSSCLLACLCSSFLDISSFHSRVNSFLSLFGFRKCTDDADHECLARHATRLGAYSLLRLFRIPSRPLDLFLVSASHCHFRFLPFSRFPSLFLSRSALCTSVSFASRRSASLAPSVALSRPLQRSRRRREPQPSFPHLLPSACLSRASARCLGSEKKRGKIREGTERRGEEIESPVRLWEATHGCELTSWRLKTGTKQKDERTRPQQLRGLQGENKNFHQEGREHQERRSTTRRTVASAQTIRGPRSREQRHPTNPRKSLHRPRPTH